MDLKDIKIEDIKTKILSVTDRKTIIKFGIGRATSDAAHQIRDGVINRDEGVDLVQKYDGEFPTLYLQESLDYLEMDKDILTKTIDKFRRPVIWEKNNNTWKLKSQVSKI